MNKKQITHWFLVIVIGIALGLGLQFVRAWTEPSTAPPGGNVGAPINTSATAQTKAGGFTASSLKAGVIEGTIVKGTTQLCIGTDCRTAWPSGGTTTITTAPFCYCTSVAYPCGSTFVDTTTDANGAYTHTTYRCDDGIWGNVGI